jgi:hypothetical protein
LNPRKKHEAWDKPLAAQLTVSDPTARFIRNEPIACLQEFQIASTLKRSFNLLLVFYLLYFRMAFIFDLAIVSF